MKKYIYICIIAMIIPASVIAQDNDNNGDKNIKIIPHELIQHGDSLYVNIDLFMEEANIESRKSLDIIPVLTNGTKSKYLPTVSIKGRRKYKEYERQLALMSRKQFAAYVKPYSVEKGYKNNNVVNYKHVIPYESWMSTAYLNIKSDLCGCGNGSRTMKTERLMNKVSTERAILPYDIIPHLAYANAEVEEVKRREIANETFLDFAVGKTDIRPNFGNNSKELMKLREMIDNIKSDKDVTIRRINITGYASPEGSIAINNKLSEGRANALKNYIQLLYINIPNEMYAIHSGGEDLDGLIKLLNDSNEPYKQAVLDIINSNIDDEVKRESRLKNLDSGGPYKEMLTYMFPSLRRVICKVDYDIKKFNLSEAKEVFKSRPQNLSLNEMYAVANTYKKGSQDYNDIFETAVRLFPDDYTANLNAAIVALTRSDIVSAERYLKNYKNKIRMPEYDNAVGVLEMLKGNYEIAEQYLNSAKQAGLAEAQQNLDEIAKKRDNIELIKKQLK